jgi:hypothetical protein
VANPHLAADRECTVLTLGPSGRLEVVKQRVGEMPVRAKSPMLTVSLYRDTSGLLTTANRLARGRQRLTHRQQELDEEDELLYGGGGKGRTEPGEEPRRGGRAEEAWRRHLEPVPPTYLLVTVRAKENFELYPTSPSASWRPTSRTCPTYWPTPPTGARWGLVETWI